MASDAKSLNGNWNFPTPVRFGAGRIKELPELCLELGIKKPLIVTDPGLAALPMLQQAEQLCKDAGLKAAVFADIKPNPVGQNIDDGVKAYKRGKHDGVVAFGGGSALDAGKAVALMVGQKRPLWDFEDVADWYTRVNVKGIAPHIAVPTTSGTGSEVGRSSLIVDEQSHSKKIIFHPRMQPWIALCDPELSLGLPPTLTGATGMDALSHNLEAYCTNFFHPLGTGIALEGMRLVHEALLDAYDNGDNLTARVKMMAASTLGATAFQKGLGAMHAVGHAVGGRFDTHHGTTVAVMMPYVLVLNRAAIEYKMAALARYLDLPDPSFQGVLSWVLELRKRVGIPHTLVDLGIDPEHVDELAAAALRDPTAGGNPVTLTADNLHGLIERAMAGVLG